jgi:hypothetical protein
MPGSQHHRTTNHRHGTIRWRLRNGYGRHRTRITEQGKDHSKLGRWSWLRLEGKQGHHLRVVSAYCPVESIGPGTVFSQHKRYLQRCSNQKEDPRQAIYTDLGNDIEKWKEEGDKILIGIDANEDVRTGNTREFFQMMGMHEVILQTYKQLNPPATCDKNNNREPIDGIFVTRGIRITSGVYAPFNTGCPSDHRYLWIDVPYTDALGYSIPPLACPPVRRLQCKNPNLVQKYNTQLSRALATENLDTDLEKISNTASKRAGHTT